MINSLKDLGVVSKHIEIKYLVLKNYKVQNIETRAKVLYGLGNGSLLYPFGEEPFAYSFGSFSYFITPDPQDKDIVIWRKDEKTIKVKSSEIYTYVANTR